MRRIAMIAACIAVCAAMSGCSSNLEKGMLGFKRACNGKMSSTMNINPIFSSISFTCDDFQLTEDEK